MQPLIQISMIVPYNREGKILLQKRTADAPNFPGYWGFFGGHIEPGETPEQAVKREAKEEIGLRLPDISLFKKYVSETHERYTYLYQTDLTEEIFRRQQQEGDDLRFFSPSETRTLDFVSELRHILDEVVHEVQRIDTK